MMQTAKIYEQIGILGAIDPDANLAGTATTGWIDMGQWQDIMAIIMAGDLGSSATLDAKFEQATSSAGAGAKDISPARAITQLTQAVTDKSNTQSLLHLKHDELDVDNNFRYVRLSFTTAVATSDGGAVVIGMNLRHGPVSTFDATTVNEMVG